MKVYKSLAILLLILTSACSSLSGKSTPDLTDNDSIDSFSDRLITVSSGSKNKLWEGNIVGAYYLRLPGYGSDAQVEAIKNKFQELCHANQGNVFDLDAESPVATYSESELINDYDISVNDIKEFGNEIKYLSSYEMKGYKKPAFGDMKISYIPGFFAQYSRVHKLIGSGQMAPRRPYWEDLSGYCANIKKRNASLIFSWSFLTNQLEYDGKGDLFIAIRNQASLHQREKKDVQKFFSAKKQEKIDIARYEIQLREEKKAELKREKQLAEKKRVEYARQENERKRLARVKAEALAAKRKRAIAFREQLQEGDESHCGLVVEVKSKVVMVQSVIGQVWIKRNEIYPDGEARCRFVNGRYISSP
ncbi:cell envelope integrity protein TolA [Bacterioplanoides sp.]|uniref:cell envelope integrity protein TolA n=1 Tax=Bacterioplanoides sp. TaxID=2066072 RepID=UPI003B5CDA4C